MTFSRRRIAGMIVLSLLVALLSITTVGAFAPSAHAQASVVGTADFRNAPQLPPGQYGDRIVTGDSAWYSIVYTNETPYNFEVAFQGSGPGPGADLTVSLVAPTLTTLDGPSQVVSGSGVTYPAGHTNVWFLKVSLATTDQLGVEYPIVLTVDGVQTVGVEECNEVSDCTLDEQYAELTVELAQARAELEQARTQETLASVENQIRNGQGFIETSNRLAPAAQSRLAQAEATMAQLCAPDALCDDFPNPGSKTPITGWIAGLAVLGLGAFRAVKKLTGGPTPANAAQAAAPQQKISSLEQARIDKRSTAKNKKKK